MDQRDLKSNILNQLKSKRFSPNISFKDLKILKKVSNTMFYVQPSYLDNLYLLEKDFSKYKKYFDKGNGKELLKKKKLGNNCKMQSLGSSSAMIVNLIGQENDNLLSIKSNNLGVPSGEFYVSFERKFRILKTSHGLIYPPNVDGFLLSKDKKTAVLIETKMLEYINSSKSEENPEYLKKNNYFKNGEHFVNCFLKAKEMFSDTSLDYSQLLKHIIGFSNAKVMPDNCFKIYDFNTEDLSKIENVCLLNIVWRMKDESNPLYKDFKKRWDEETRSINQLDRVAKLLIEATGNSFKKISVKFVPFDEFINIVDYSNKHRKYLDRYFI